MLNKLRKITWRDCILLGVIIALVLFIGLVVGNAYWLRDER